MMLLRNFILVMGFAILMILSSCTYDNVEELYPSPPSCDTTDLTYSKDIGPIIDASCAGCHSGSAPSGNISLANYNDVVISAQNGSLLGTIRHENGWSPMPKNGNKLDDCSIKKIETWVESGTPNN